MTSCPNELLLWNAPHMFRSADAVVWNARRSLLPLASLMPFSAALIAFVYAPVPNDSAVCT